jgi:hypothetical protein
MQTESVLRFGGSIGHDARVDRETGATSIRRESRERTANVMNCFRSHRE